MRPLVRYRTASANLLPARPHEVFSLAFVERLNSGLYSPKTVSGSKAAKETIKRSRRFIFALIGIGANERPLPAIPASFLSHRARISVRGVLSSGEMGA